jgi:hypothetical protein
LPPLGQAMVAAVAVATAFGGLLLLMGDVADPRLAYALIAVMSVISAALVYRRAYYRERMHPMPPPVIKSPILGALVALVLGGAYGAAVGLAFMRYPGKLPYQAVNLGIFIGGTTALSAYRRRKGYADTRGLPLMYTVAVGIIALGSTAFVALMK